MILHPTASDGDALPPVVEQRLPRHRSGRSAVSRNEKSVLGLIVVVGITLTTAALLFRPSLQRFADHIAMRNQAMQEGDKP